MKRENLREGYQPINSDVSNRPNTQSGHQPVSSPKNVTPPNVKPVYSPKKSD